jgi:hypothetical protein
LRKFQGGGNPMNWVRLWHDMPNDPKWRVVSKRSGRPLVEVIAVFVHMLTNAGANATERGVLDNWWHDDIAAALDMEPEHVEAIYEAMQGKTLDGAALTGWEKRQPKREDGAAERAKAWRERNRTQPNARKRPDTEADTDTDKITHPSEFVATREADGRTDDPFFVKCKIALNGTTERAIEIVRQADGVYGTKAGAAQWLAELIDDTSADAVIQAVRFAEAKRDRREIVANPKALIAKTAQTAKANVTQPADAKPVSVRDTRPAWVIEKETRRKSFMDAIKNLEPSI